MAGIKVTELPSIDTLSKTDVTYVIDSNNDTSKKATIQKVVDAVDQIQGGDPLEGTQRKVSANYGNDLILVSGQSGSFSGLGYLDDYSPNYNDNSLIARKDAPKVIISSDTPCAEQVTPLRIGDIWIDKGTNELYYSVNIDDCGGWTKLPSTQGSTWSPTIVSQAGSCGNMGIVRAYYTRVGNIVSCSIQGAGEFNFIKGIQGYIEIDYPIPTTSYQPIGVGQLANTAINCNVSMLDGEGLTAKIQFFSNSLNFVSSLFAFTFQYEIN
jgi:hypothetical protein